VANFHIIASRVASSAHFGHTGHALRFSSLPLFPGKFKYNELIGNLAYVDSDGRNTPLTPSELAAVQDLAGLVSRYLDRDVTQPSWTCPVTHRTFTHRDIQNEIDAIVRPIWSDVRSRHRSLFP